MAEEFPRGQISTLILMCLTDADMYGYEIINAVYSKTNGKVSIKQPSLYSSLKRMEEQSLISSYWRDSEIGGRRHYYHLTDLGKKHLEKWQTNLSIPIQTNESSSSENTTKVLHQENLFSLTNNQQEEKANEIVVESPVPPSFLQYDLFATSSGIAPASSEPTNINPKTSQMSTDHEIKKEDNVVNNELKESLKTYSFDYVKKGNKSFTDTIKTKINYDENKFNLTHIPTISEKEPIKPTTIDFIEKIGSQHGDLSKNENQDTTSEHIENNEYTHKISIENLEGYINQNKPVLNDNFSSLNNEASHLNNFNDLDQTTHSSQEIKDDGVIITERIDIKDLPKSPKWEARKFEIYISDDSITPKFSEHHKVNYEDRIKDLYEKSKSNAENQELELIDSKFRFNSYADLQNFYSEQNIKFKPFQKSLYKSQKKFDMIRINKLNMLTSLFNFISISLISLILGFILTANKLAYLNSPLTFLILPVIYLIYCLLMFIIYKKSPQKRIAFDINKFKLNDVLIILSIFVIPIIIALNLFAGFNFSNFAQYSITLIYPCLLSLIYLISYLTQHLLIKFKMMY